MVLEGVERIGTLQGVVAQWCNPLTLQPKRSEGVGSNNRKCKRGHSFQFLSHFAELFQIPISFPYKEI